MNNTNTQRFWLFFQQCNPHLAALAGIATGLVIGTGQGNLYQAHFSQKLFVAPEVQTHTLTSFKEETLRPAAPAAPLEASSSSASALVIFPSSAALSSAPTVSSEPVHAEAAASSVQAIGVFPPLHYTQHPVSRVPNWGAMRSPAVWNRSYREMTTDDFVSVPSYNLSTLTIPLLSLIKPLHDEDIPTVTAKLYYSTRYMGKYDLDAHEFSGDHDGVDLKLAPGTPVGAIGGGKVFDVRTDNTLGLHVLIEHRTKNGERYLSIYGHLASASLVAGEDVAPGQTVGTVGMTGNTSGPHLHLAVHQKQDAGSWNTYDASESINPMGFIAKFRGGEL